MQNRKHWKEVDDLLREQYPELAPLNDNSRDIRGWYAEKCYEAQMPEGAKLNIDNGILGNIDAIEPERGRVEIKFGKYNDKKSLSILNEIDYYYRVHADKINVPNIHYKMDLDIKQTIDGITWTTNRRFWFCPDLDLAKQNIHRIFRYTKAEYIKFNK